MLQFLRLGRKGYTAIVHNMKTVSLYLAKEIANMSATPVSLWLLVLWIIVTPFCAECDRLNSIPSVSVECGV